MLRLLRPVPISDLYLKYRSVHVEIATAVYFTSLPLCVTTILALKAMLRVVPAVEYNFHVNRHGNESADQHFRLGYISLLNKMPPTGACSRRVASVHSSHRGAPSWTITNHEHLSLAAGISIRFLGRLHK